MSLLLKALCGGSLAALALAATLFAPVVAAAGAAQESAPQRVFVVLSAGTDDDLQMLDVGRRFFEETLTGDGGVRVAGTRDSEGVVMDCLEQIGLDPATARECRLRAARRAMVRWVLELDLGAESAIGRTVTLDVWDPVENHKDFTATEIMEADLSLEEVRDTLQRLARRFRESPVAMRSLGQPPDSGGGGGGGEGGGSVGDGPETLISQPPTAGCEVIGGSCVEIHGPLARDAVRLSGRAVGHTPTPGACGGYVGDDPGHTLVLHSDARGARLRVIADAATVLVIEGPGGSFCAEGGRNTPVVLARDLGAGVWRIRVGTASLNSSHAYRLDIGAY